MKLTQRKPPQPPTDKWYSYVRCGNFIIQYRDYVLGYMDGQTDRDDNIKNAGPLFGHNEDLMYETGYKDGYLKRPIKRDKEI